jgi:serine/threonine-protein kinase
MRQCVVKQFQPTGDLNLQQLKIAQDLFEREAEVLEELGSRHPQIPDLFAFFPLCFPSLQLGKEDQFFYLVQEYIDGQDLEAELKTKGQFSEAEALEVLQEILKVLKFVHENHSIHRDIKPSNIMRHRNGLLYLLDFGAVKQVTTKGAAAGAPSGRSTGIYSMGFAPPEQMAGAEVYPSTDLYALAVTVITLLTGRDPETLYEAYSNQWLWRNYASVSDTLANVLDRMLLPAPNQRFQSAQEALDALTTRQPLPPPPPPVNPLPQVSPNRLPSTTLPPVTPVNPQPPSRRPAFSILEILGGAAFAGFEAGLLFVTLRSLLGFSGLSMGLLGMIVGALIFAQYRRSIEGKDLPIIAGLTLAGVLFFALQNDIPLPSVIVQAVLVAAGAIAVTALFRLVYLLLSRLL